MIPNTLLPEQYRADAFIAGGFAACPALASDIDVWIPVSPGTCNAARDEILQYLRETQDNFSEQDGDTSPRGRIQHNVALANSQLLSTFEGYHMVLGLRRVATVNVVGASLPYHLIVVEGSLDDVLSSFDISTHQVALTPKGVVKGADWTSIFEPPVVITEKYTTPQRLEKIRARYAR
jgi:hypothetical protein